MKRRRVKSIESQMDGGRWENLPEDLLLKIFEGLSDKDLFWTVSSVCRSWQLVCWDMLFWKEETLDLRKLMNFLSVKGSELYDPLAERLLKLLKSIMDSDGDGLPDRRTLVTSIVFPPHICLSDRHLVYVAERSPKLKRFDLPGTIRITGKGFSRAICNWIEMEQMSMGPFYFFHYDRIIQEMGRNCRKLDTLCIYGSMYIFDGKYDPDRFELDLSKSLVIANNLHRLKVLSLTNSVIFKFGLKTILCKCRQLLKLNLANCMILNDGSIVRTSTPTRKPCYLEIKKVKEGNCMKWSIDTQERLHSLIGVIDCSWTNDLYLLHL